MGKDNLLEQATIIHSSRHSVGLEITKEGHLLLRVPYGVTRTELEKIVARKENWIRKAQQRVKKRTGRPLPVRDQRRGNFSAFWEILHASSCGGKRFFRGERHFVYGE